MSQLAKEIVNLITEPNNSYRSTKSTVRQKILALWEIGNQLFKSEVEKPHQVGWAVQNDTRGLIKRSTVIKGYRLRSIWPSKEALMGDLGGVRTVASVMDMIPLIDPSKPVRNKLSQDKISEIFSRAQQDTSESFRRYITDLKHQYSHGQLGKPLDRSKRLSELKTVIDDLRTLIADLYKIINSTDENVRLQFRTSVSNSDLAAFSNMCIALTTKDNIRLYKKMGPPDSESKNEAFRRTYSFFHGILNKKSGEERARLRRLISAEALAQISDMTSSLISEKSVLDYRARQKIIIKM